MQSLMNGVFTPKDGAVTPVLRVIANRAANVASALAMSLVLFGMLATSGCIGYSGNPAGTSKAGLHLTPNAIDFGSVGVGSNASQPVIVGQSRVQKSYAYKHFRYGLGILDHRFLRANRFAARSNSETYCRICADVRGSGERKHFCYDLVARTGDDGHSKGKRGDQFIERDAVAC